MKTAVISDIHANLEAFLTVLIDIRKKSITKIINLGDILGYGADPVSCLEACMNLQEDGIMESLLGNHCANILDKCGNLGQINPSALKSDAWTKEQLKPNHLDFLNRLPIEKTEGKVVYVHGCPVARESEAKALATYATINCRRNNDMSGLDDAFEAMKKFGFDICFVGHYHRPEVFRMKKGFCAAYEEVDIVPGQPISLEEGFFYTINPGSVGQPRIRRPGDDLRTGYLIFDGQSVTFFKLDYDVKTAVQKILKNPDLPKNYAHLINYDSTKSK